MTRFHDLKLYLKAHLWLVPVLAAAVGLFVWALDPAPPSHPRLAAGVEGGGYHAFGERLKARLAAEGIELELVDSGGSTDNLRLLLTADSPVQIGLVQSGAELNLSEEERRRLRGLGALYREPLWLFQRRELKARRLADLIDKRIGIGSDASLHPALTPLLLESSRKVLREGSLLDPPDRFPQAEPSGFPLTKEADSYYRTGLPYLQRFLPFRIASVVDRYIVLLIPFLAVLLPLTKLISPIYEWRMRSRIYRWYRHLHEVDALLHDGTLGPRLDEEIARLADIEKELGRVDVPLSFSHELYALHLHVRYMIERLKGLKPSPPE